jgi:short-subunit dehydrogenase
METIRKLMEVNFFGTVGLTKAVLPGMIKQKEGHIVIISSVMGKIGTKYRSSYAASKHALHGWFDCLRQEVLEHNVSKNALTADGTPLNEMGNAHKRAMEPKEFAEKLFPKLARGKEEIYIGGTEILTIYIKRLMPSLLNRILQRTKVT